MLRTAFTVLVCWSLLRSPVGAEVPGPTTPASAPRWDLTEIYADWQAWQKDLNGLMSVIGRFAAMETGEFRDPTQLLAAIRTWDDVHRRAMKVEGYVGLRLDLAQNDPEARARRVQVGDLDRRWGEASDWFETAVRALPGERLEAWLVWDSDLAVHRLRLERMREAQPGPSMVEYGELDRIFEETLERLHSALSFAGGAAPRVTLSNGEVVVLSQAKVRSFLATLQEPADRAKVGRAWYEARSAGADAHAALLEGVVRRQLALAGTEGPRGAVVLAAGRWDVPAATIEGLIAGAHAALGDLREYHQIRAAKLGLESYRMSDRFVPLAPADGTESTYDYALITDWIVDSLAVLGDDYQSTLRKGLSEGWVDIGKRNGRRATPSVSWVYGAHPYILLNWGGSFRDALSAAHESGHAMHNLLAHTSQPFVYSRFPSLLAEVAAITSEGLLVEYLGTRPGDERGRLARVDLAAQALTRTYFRTVMDAEFELEVYKSVASGEALSGERMGSLYERILGSYYGDSVVLEPWDRHAWMDVRHFFTAPMYMFQYGISHTAAAGFIEQLAGPDPDPESFLAFLRAGSSRKTADLLALSGIDPLEPSSLGAAAKRMRELVAGLE